MSRDALDSLFYPKTVAVLGSLRPVGHGHQFIEYLLSYGFSGQIYPVNPGQTEVSGLKAYPDLDHVPGTVDHVDYAIPLDNILDILAQASRKGVKTMHIYAGRASETGRPEAKKLDAEILKRAREYGIRVLGPNSLGLFCPKSGLAFNYDFPREPGNVGAIMQSGANSTDLCHFSALRGIRFSKVASYGNALDINEIDLFEYFGEDPETKIILSYIEGLRVDRKKFFELVHKIASKKPVIICKGGRTKAGARWALRHTASRAGSAKTWEASIRQAGAIPVRNIDELVDMAVAFSFLPPVRGNRVGMGGGGGGNCVLLADAWEENGFDVIPLPQDIREEYKKKGAEVWDWIDNPVDWSMLGGEGYHVSASAALSEMAKHPDFDLIVGNVGEDHPANKDRFSQMLTPDIEGYIKISKERNKPFLAILGNRSLSTADMDHWRYRLFAQVRTRFIEEHVPFFPTVEQAARAVKELINYYKRNG